VQPGEDACADDDRGALTVQPQDQVEQCPAQERLLGDGYGRRNCDPGQDSIKPAGRGGRQPQT
jgi:hypothetical protein